MELTDRQAEILEAVNRLGTMGAAKALGIGDRCVRKTMEVIRQKTGPLPTGTPGTSTLIDADGQVKAQWVKSRHDAQEAQKRAQAARDALLEGLPRERAVGAPKRVQDDLLNLYVITDYHIGMRAWPEETGEDWNVQIAENLLADWFRSVIRDAPRAHTGVFCQLGDFLHWDGIEAVTPTSGHILDADTRFQKLIRVAIRGCRRIIRELLKRHQHVHVLMAEGNHDPASSMWLRELLAAFYDDEPRVTVDLSPDPYYCVEWGDTSLFFHHGHKKKMAQIDDVFVAKYRDVFGRTKHSYAHMGNLHHERSLETNLMTVEQHRTLAAPDAYASRGGWMSGRSAQCITYHKQYGRVGVIEKGPELL